jgi:succinate dehydrogenase hydrophobic anchor subunit
VIAAILVNDTAFLVHRVLALRQIIFTTLRPAATRATIGAVNDSYSNVHGVTMALFTAFRTFHGITRT